MFDESATVRSQLAALRQEHRSLDEMISDLSKAPFPNQLQLVRLKKRKLRLKDAITRLESKLIPDLPA